MMQNIEPSYACERAWLDCDASLKRPKNSKSIHRYYNLRWYAEDRQKRLEWEISRGAVDASARWSFGIYFDELEENPRYFFRTPDCSDSPVYPLRDLPRLRLKDSESGVGDFFDDEVNLATQFAGKGEDARKAFDEHGVLTVPQKNAGNVFDIVKLETMPRNEVVRLPRGGGAGSGGDCAVGVSFDKRKADDREAASLEALRDRFLAHRGMTSTLETDRAGDPVRVSSPRLSMDDSPRRSLNVSPSPNLSPLSSSPGTPVARNSAKGGLVGFFDRLGIRSPEPLPTDEGDEGLTPASRGTKKHVSRVCVPAVHVSPDEWIASSGDEALAYYHSVAKMKSNGTGVAAPNLVVTSWRKLLEEDEAWLATLRRRHAWNRGTF
jgi:hypothetical protein